MVECSCHSDILVEDLPLLLRVWVYLEPPDKLENVTSIFPGVDVIPGLGGKITWFASGFQFHKGSLCLIRASLQWKYVIGLEKTGGVACGRPKRNRCEDASEDS